jgi:hypothetical protein
LGLGDINAYRHIEYSNGDIQQFGVYEVQDYSDVSAGMYDENDFQEGSSVQPSAANSANN